MAEQQARIALTADASQATREITNFAGKVSGLSTQVQGYIGGIGTSVGALSARMGALAALIGAGAFAAGIKSQIDLQDATRKSAQAAGLSVDAFDELAYAAKLADTDSDTLTKGLGKLSNALVKAASGEPDMKRLFKQTLGIDVRDAAGHLRQTDQVMEDVAERFASMEDGAKKVALAGEIFGEKMGPRLIPFLNQGKAGIQELREELRKLKGVTSEESSAAAEQFNDNMTRMGVASEGFKMVIANSVLPTLVEFSNFFVKAAKDVGVLGAAWLTFGKGMARLVGADDIGQLRTQHADLGAEMERIKLIQIGLQNTLDRDPGNQAAARRMGRLTDKLRELQAQADTTRAAIAKMEADAQGPAAKPRTGNVTVDDDGGGSGGKPKPAAPSRIGEWANLLAEQKQAYAQGMALQGQFTEWGHAEESRFWQGILSRADLGQAERQAAQSRYLDAERAGRLAAAGANLAEQQVAIAAAASQYDQQAQLMAAYVQSVGTMHGQESKQYQDALRQQLAMQREHASARRNIANIERAAAEQDQLDTVTSQERAAELQRNLGLITQQQLLEVRARSIEQRRQIEEQAKLAELEAEKGGVNDPVRVAQLQAEIAAIKQRFRGLKADNDGAQKVDQADPLNAIFGTSQQALQGGLQSMVSNMKLTLGGIRDVARSIGGSIVQELVTKPLAAFIVGGARKVAMAWFFGEGEVAANAAAGAQKVAIEGSVSLSVIAMRAYQAAAGAYAAIAAIPYIGPVLAPIAAGVALAGAIAFAKNIFSAEGGFDIPKGMNPMVQAHSNEMILPSKHADTMRALSDLHLSGNLAGGGGGGTVEIKATPMAGDFFMVHRAQLVKALKASGRNFEV
jgi:hypothetical protein